VREFAGGFEPTGEWRISENLSLLLSLRHLSSLKKQTRREGQNIGRESKERKSSPLKIAGGGGKATERVGILKMGRNNMHRPKRRAERLVLPTERSLLT